MFAKATTSGKSLTVSNITFNTRNLEVNGYDTVNITNNTFEDITTFRKVEGVIAADAIYVYGSNTGTVTIKGNTINGVRDDINHPGDGIGITIHDYDNITIDDNTISDTYHNCVNLYRGIAGEVKITNNTFSNWDSNQDYQKEDGKYYYKKNGEETEVSAGCEGGRALRLALDSTATLTVTGNTFEPNNNTEPIDPDYVKITGYDESKVDTLIASLVNSNTWPDGVDYSKAILVNTTEGPSIEEPDEGENSEPVNGDSGTPE
ncbi:MAG TPA: right-handed parallel beta-helix repeat-containing protein [Fervidobacterium sp.]|nr:right-handed parallel beta-helix repeat-containing protein [Fervidobacterium sp.]